MASQAVERGKQLRKARVDAGLSQKAAAKLAGIHAVTLSDIERGKNKDISAATLFSLAAVYGLPADDFTDTAGSGKTKTENPETRLARGIVESTGLIDAPRVALGIPQRIRVWLQEFLLDLTKAGVSEDEIGRIRRILSSDEMFRYYAGGEPKEYSEDETLEGIQAHAEAFRRDLRRRGYKLPK